MGVHGEGEGKKITLKYGEYEKLTLDLAKSKNQIVHLKRAIVEIEGGDPSSIGGSAGGAGAKASASAAPTAIDSSSQVTI